MCFANYFKSLRNVFIPYHTIEWKIRNNSSDKWANIWRISDKILCRTERFWELNGMANPFGSLELTARPPGVVPNEVDRWVVSINESGRLMDESHYEYDDHGSADSRHSAPRPRCGQVTHVYVPKNRSNTTISWFLTNGGDNRLSQQSLGSGFVLLLAYDWN